MSNDLNKVDMSSDMWQDMWARQISFMDILRDGDKMPEFPVDISSKMGQRIVKETIFNLTEELFEASYTLKNRVHRVTDDRGVDFAHYKEELGDALAYFIEVCILSGISPRDLYEEFKRKNRVVKERFQKGY